jgi:anthranilate phosphoribosyltransferase
MIRQSDLQDLIHLRMPEADALAMLGQLTPDQVTLPLLQEALTCVRETALSVTLPELPVMDCCGTGGSGLSHFNTSTTVAFVLAAAGVPVVKFGNRGLSSACGSFDLLEQIGIPHQISLDRIPDILCGSNLVFLFAPACYPALVPFNQLRRTLKTRTIFNFLGPLLNPVQPAFRLLGVSHPGMQDLMAQHLQQEATSQAAWLVHGLNGLDEIALHAPTRVLAVHENAIQETVLPQSHQENNFPQHQHASEENLGIFRCIVAGDDTESIYYHMVCRNAAAGLVVSGQADNIDDAMLEVQTLLKSGIVAKTVEHCRRAHEQFAN